MAIGIPGVSMTERPETEMGRPNAETGELQQRFARLISEHAALASGSQQSLHPRTVRVRTLLDGFREIRGRAEATQQLRVRAEHERMRSVLAGYKDAMERYRLEQGERAVDFN